MRFHSLTFFSLLASLPVQERLSPKAELAAKLNSPFLQNVDWILDYDEALVAARKRKTLIFGYFTTAGY